MLADVDGKLRYVASSSERMRLIELFELQQDQGPCLDAYHSGVAIHCASVAEAKERWPRFGPHAEEVGFASVSALPMRLRNDVIGALNVFSATAGALGAEDRIVAQTVADIATIGILQERAVRDAHILASQLEAALESRVAIEQAKGIVAERAHVTVDAAFTLLRGYARRHNHLLRQTASEVIHGRLSVEALSASPGKAEPPAPHSDTTTS